MGVKVKEAAVEAKEKIEAETAGGLGPQVETSSFSLSFAFGLRCAWAPAFARKGCRRPSGAAWWPHSPRLRLAPKEGACSVRVVKHPEKSRESDEVLLARQNFISAARFGYFLRRGKQRGAPKIRL